MYPRRTPAAVELLEQAERKNARLEDELAAYDELNARIAQAQSLSDLLAG